MDICWGSAGVLLLLWCRDLLGGSAVCLLAAAGLRWGFYLLGLVGSWHARSGGGS